MATPILGMMGTGSYGADDIPDNWRRAIMRLQPNGDTPLMGMLSMLDSQETSSPHFHWWEKDPAVIEIFINNGAGYALGILALAVDNGAGTGMAAVCKAGTMLYVARTGEIMRVAVDPAVGTTITVARGVGTTAAQALVDDDPIYVIGSAYEEGASVPTAQSWLPTESDNYTQIFRTALDATRTDLQTNKRWGTGKSYPELVRDAWEIHMKGLEFSLIFGEQAIDVTSGYPRRITRGIRGSVAAANLTNFAGSFTEDDLDAALEGVFRYGNQEKLLVGGSTVLSNFAKIAKTKGQLEPVPGNETYGMVVRRYVTPFGSLILKNHPLMNQIATMRDSAIIVDLPYCKLRYIQDTVLLQNRQDSGEDRLTDEFLSEIGFEIQCPLVHAGWTNFDGFVP